MKIKIFAIVCVGALLMMGISSILVYTQVRAVQKVNLDPLAEHLNTENSKVLGWIIATVPIEKVDSLKLPESWAEIFVVNEGDLQLVSSTNPAHRGVALYRHPQLLDQGAAIMNAIKARKATTVSSKEFKVIIQPLATGQSIVALKPKAWEGTLVSRQNNEIKESSFGVMTILGIFLAAGSLLAVITAFVITRAIAAPTTRALEALEALSLGDFDHELDTAKGREMTSFTESYLRLKASLEMALERISRR